MVDRMTRALLMFEYEEFWLEMSLFVMHLRILDLAIDWKRKRRTRRTCWKTKETG